MKLKNESFDGSPVEFQMDSRFLAVFDPLALDQLSALMPVGAPLEPAELLDRANADYSAVACYSIPNFSPGLFTFDPREIKKLGDDDSDEFDYGEDEQVIGSGEEQAGFLFFAVDSGSLILADLAHLTRLLNLLTWEIYDLSLRDETALTAIIQGLGGAYFAVIGSAGQVGMQFDGDGTYAIAPDSLKRVEG